MFNFNISEKGLGLVSPWHFVYDFSIKMFLNQQLIMSIIYILILKQEINSQPQKVSKLKSKILVEKSVIKHKLI